MSTDVLSINNKMSLTSESHTIDSKFTQEDDFPISGWDVRIPMKITVFIIYHSF